MLKVYEVKQGPGEYPTICSHKGPVWMLPWLQIEQMDEAEKMFNRIFELGRIDAFEQVQQFIDDQ